MKKSKIHYDFEQVFGEILFSKKFDYVISIDDLYTAAKIFNEHIFKNKLNLSHIEIITVDFNGQTSKGNTSFGKYQRQNAKFLIKIVKYATGDNFYQIMNVLAHELIHVYDMTCGEILSILKRHYDEVLSGFYVTNVNDNQYVGIEKYDAHGKYFKTFADKFNKLGFNVQQKYDITGKTSMKKLSEKTTGNRKQEEFFYETDDSKEALTYQYIKSFYDSLIAPEKRFVYRNAKEWFIEFP